MGSCSDSAFSTIHPGGGGGDSAGSRLPTTPPPLRGPQANSYCQRCWPGEYMGAKGAQWSTSTRTTCVYILNAWSADRNTVIPPDSSYKKSGGRGAEGKGGDDPQASAPATDCPPPPVPPPPPPSLTPSVCRGRPRTRGNRGGPRPRRGAAGGHRTAAGRRGTPGPPPAAHPRRRRPGPRPGPLVPTRC